MNKAIEWIKKGCKAKRKLSLARAELAIDAQALRGHVYYYYQCPLCNSYHLTRGYPCSVKHKYVRELLSDLYSSMNDELRRRVFGKWPYNRCVE